jgi:hypothetical protein
MSAPETTTPREGDPGDATEVNRRQTTDIPNGIGGDRGHDGVERADVQLFLDAEEPQENAADAGGEEGPATCEGPPVDGAELLGDIERFAGRFLAFPTVHHLVVLCLWVVHTWAVGAFYVTPRLVLDSPEPGSGKTRVLEILALLCHDAKLTLSTTTAALYRRIKSAGDKPPTILQDECDAVFGRTNNFQAEDLRGLFNAGYKTGATVDRCEGPPSAPLAVLTFFLDRLGLHEPAAVIAGFTVSPLTATATPEINTAMVHLRDVLGDQIY